MLASRSTEGAEAMAGRRGLGQVPLVAMCGAAELLHVRQAKAKAFSQQRGGACAWWLVAGGRCDWRGGSGDCELHMSPPAPPAWRELPFLLTPRTKN